MTWLLLYAQAFASTITVGGGSGDYPSIQEAIDNSLDGDVINVSTGTYNENLLFDGRELSILGNQSTLAPINSNDTVRWLNGASVEISDFHILPNASRAFYSVNSDASVKNSTVSNSGHLNTLNGGTIYVDAGSFNLSEVTIDTSTGQWGGTVYAINAAQLEWNQVEITTSSGEYGGTLYLDESVLVAFGLSIDDTQANFSGGGLYLIDSEVTLNEFELNNCQGDQTWGAGIYATGTLLTINDGLISSCKALDFLSGYGGGAIYATSASTLDFFDVYLSDSTAYFGGGMALGWTTNASLVNFTAFDNRANNIGNTALGGALFIGPTANVACTNCSFLDNEADQGGAIAIESGGLFSDEAGVYTSNQASNAGGAVYFENTVDASFTQSRFEQNSSGTGGAVYIAGSSLVGAQFSEVNFVQNTALNGGGALSLLGSSEITISNSNFKNNTSDTTGGAIQCANTNGSIYITDSLLEYNVATTLGGAIYSSTANGIVLERLTFLENASGSNGGAWYHNSGQASASLSQWLSNRSQFGGAIAIEQSSLDTKLINNSFVENLAYSEGAHLWIASGEIIATNNIYAFGLGGGGLYADTASMNSQLSYGDAWANIDGDYTGSLVDPTGSSGNISEDPLFRDYLPGGTEEDDLHLSSGSPCVNAGDPTLLAPDLSRSDIGAYGGQNATTKDDDLDGFLDLVDCDDQDASINPNATEIAYDGIDQDCDGGDLRDIDLDSYEATAVGGDDCDDTKSSVNPGASETYYDGVDQNCDGLSDFDADHDAEDASVFGGLDCDDTNDQINTLAIETLYDGIDQNCDGRSDFDGDRDGYDSDNYGGLDCDDTRNDVYPGATEVPYDMVDQNCDGADLKDADFDGYEARSIGGEDCDDTNSAIHPGATEIPYDSIDQNCDGLSDFDGDQDGYDAESYGGLDCDDTVASINPSQVDIFYDGVDQDCDGRSDFDYDQDGEDADFANGLDCNDTDPSINTTAIEIYYDNIDQNCDDHSDDDSDFDGFDADFRGGNDCDDTNDQLNPNATEIPYDGIDQDCTGLDWNDIDNDGFIGTLAGGTDCNDNNADIHPGHAETWYDGIDQNCDGSSDFDSDYDSFDSDLYGGDDCDDTQSTTFPGANDIPYDGIDSDCAGDDDFDADGDGYPLADDCDDNRSEAYPGATELENNLDDDCDGYSEQVDRDDDGLSDWQEWTLGTNPEDMDSDNDGLSDGDEAEAGIPLDSDGDGFINPLDPDDDGDGILTQAELTTDTNGDGKSDLDVDEDGISNHLDLDSDNDGYTDAIEGEQDQDLDGIPDYLDYSGDYIGGGCGGGQNGGLLLSLLLLVRRWRSLSLTLLIPSSALAQSFEIDGLQWLGELGIVESPTRLSLPDSQLKTPFAIGFLTSYAKNPILETTADGIVPLVDELVVNHLRLSGSPVDRLQLDLEMPFLAMGGLSTERFSGIGDLRLGIKGTILGEENNTPGVGVSLLSWFPTGNSDLGLGNRYANMGLIASTQKSIGPLLLAANMGARIGPSDPIRNLTSGVGPLMGLSVGIVPISSFGLHLECLSHGSAGWKKLPVELMGSSTWKITRRLWLSGSAGGGLTSGIGSPEWRALANVGWRWAPKQIQPTPIPYLIQVPQKANEQTRPHDRKQPVLAEIQDERIVLYDVIHFEEGSANLLPQSTPLLSAVLDLLIIHLEIQHLLIEGHTNHHGDYTSNLELSAARSVAVMNWLVAHGINPHRLVCKGYGSHRPLVSPDHPKAIEINRRVEFTILRPDPKSTSKP